MVKKKKKYFQGVGEHSVKTVYNRVGVNCRKPFGSFKTSQRIIISKLKHKISYTRSLKGKLKETLDYLISLKTYRGVRHLLSYPVRGQRTHTNAKTRKKLRSVVVIPKLSKKLPNVPKKR